MRCARCKAGVVRPREFRPVASAPAGGDRSSRENKEVAEASGVQGHESDLASARCSLPPVAPLSWATSGASRYRRIDALTWRCNFPQAGGCGASQFNN